MGDVSFDRQMMYALCDALGMTLDMNLKTGVVTGDDVRHVNLEGLRVKVKPHVVSSLLTQNAYMVIVKVLGNLALFVAAKSVKNGTVVDLHVLNIAKMDQATGWLEKHQPGSVNAAVKKMGDGVVKGFVKIKKDEWELVT